MPPLLQLQKIPGKGDGGRGKKIASFFGWPEDRDFVGKKCVLVHPIAWATSYCLLSDTFWLRASKNAFKVSSVKFANSLSPPSIVKEVRTGSKSSQELSDAGQKSGELTTPPQPPNREGLTLVWWTNLCTPFPLILFSLFVLNSIVAWLYLWELIVKVRELIHDYFHSCILLFLIRHMHIVFLVLCC